MLIIPLFRMLLKVVVFGVMYWVICGHSWMTMVVNMSPAMMISICSMGVLPSDPRMAIRMPKRISLVRILRRRGICGLRMIIMRGSVMNTATVVDDMSAVDTMMGMLLMNSPMIPVASSRGINAQTVVRVVVQIGVMKSLQTRSPVWVGVNFSVR